MTTQDQLAEAVELMSRDIDGCDVNGVTGEYREDKPYYIDILIKAAKETTSLRESLKYHRDHEIHEGNCLTCYAMQGRFDQVHAAECAGLRGLLGVARMALEEIREVYAGSELGEPVYAQEAYAIQCVKEQYKIACEALAKMEGKE